MVVWCGVGVVMCGVSAGGGMVSVWCGTWSRIKVLAFNFG